jgi:hypothetical protein
MATSVTSQAERAQQIKLSTKGLENAALLGINDFALHVGSEKFECSRFEAAFLSPRITELLLQDPTIDEYEIDISIESVQDIEIDVTKHEEPDFTFSERFV